ncbi:MAG: rhomboid family intramembrane serine protease [Spirochaetota bacterium]|nr:rhomboid family intramembrane serine protease [Spirochaetota bacterium]
MIPIKDENPTYYRSIVTYIIIIMNVLIWIFIQKLGTHPDLLNSIIQYGLIPGDLLGLVKPGTQVPVGDGLAYVLDGKPNWLTPVTSMFMHGGWLHLIGNMWFLGIFGDNVEDILGPVKFIIFYILCGICAAAAQIAADPSSQIPMVGASGAIGGVMGAYAVMFPRAPVHMLIIFGFFITRIIVPAFFMLGYWFILQLIGGFFSSGMGGVAFWAHIGGFFSGILLIKLLCTAKRAEECRLRRGTTNRMISRY